MLSSLPAACEARNRWQVAGWADDMLATTSGFARKAAIRLRQTLSSISRPELFHEKSGIFAGIVPRGGAREWLGKDFLSGLARLRQSFRLTTFNRQIGEHCQIAA